MGAMLTTVLSLLRGDGERGVDGYAALATPRTRGALNRHWWVPMDWKGCP
jgi:hypothetical protein